MTRDSENRPNRRDLAVKFRGRALFVSGVGLLAAGSLALPANAAMNHAMPGSHRGWETYLEQPTTSNVRPVSATVLSGSVANPRGLTARGGGLTTLTVRPGGRPATVLLDYGKDIEGYPYVTVKSHSSGSTPPSVSLAFSEARQYMWTP